MLKSSLRFEADGTGTRSVQTRVRLQTDGALQQFGQVVLSYNSEFERLAIKGRVIKPDGTTTEIPASAIQDMSSPVSQVAPMYSDIRQKHVVVPGLRPGDVLEYELQFDQFAPMAPNQFWAAYDFNRSSIVKDEELRLDVPAGKHVNVKTLPGHKPEMAEADGRRLYSWKTSHLKRDDDVSDRKPKPKKEPEPPAVQLTTFQNWAEVGDWYARLENDRRLPNDALRAKAAELTKGMTDESEKLRAIYRFVAQDFRYVSLSFGMGRYQPHAAAEVLGNRYGDCKDKHTLLAAMAEAAGLRVQAALTSATRKVDPDFPSPQQFDHVISYVPSGSGDLWLDTTTELAPFGMLLAPVRKKHALVVAAEGKSALRETPTDPAVPNMQVITVDGTLDELGNLDINVRLAFRGDAEVLGRLTARAVPQAKWNEYMKLLATSSGMEGEISAVEISPVAETQGPLEYRFRVTAPNYFNRFEKDPKLELPLGTLHLVDPSDTDEHQPMVLMRSRAEYHLKLRLPSQFEAHLPVGVDLNRDYGEYKSRYALEGATLTGERMLMLKVNELPPQRRDDFQAFRQTVAADADQRVAVKAGEIVGATGAPGGKASSMLDAANAAYDNGEYQTSADLIERVVKEEPAHKTAYGDLGRAYFALGRLDKAEAALKKATELNPYTPSAYNHLGRVYWAQKGYESAAKEFRKQIEIVPLDPWAHKNLGLMLVEQKKYAEAEPELEKAVAMSEKDAFLYMALGKAQLNLDKPDKAQESFDRAVEIFPSPPVWNDVAYALAEHRTHLDRARQYAESAVAMLTAELRNVRLDGIKLQDLMMVYLLATSWDTLGWVRFKMGDTAPAVRYLSAAWQLGQHPASADHLGQVYERSGKRDLAIEYYSLAAADPRPEPGSREHLAALVGEAKVLERLRGQGQRLGDLRAYEVPGAKGDGNADFFVALAPGPRVVEARFISGDDELKSLVQALKAVSFKMDFPDEGDARVFRRGILSCRAPEKEPDAGSCTFVLLKPGDVTSTN